MRTPDRRLAGAALVLLLALTAALLERRQPAWLTADPLLHPFGREADEGAPPTAAPAGPVPVRIEHASREELVALPGIGPVTADRILAWRDTTAAIEHPDDLLAVKGIGPKRLARLRPWLIWPSRADSSSPSSP